MAAPAATPAAATATSAHSAATTHEHSSTLVLFNGKIAVLDEKSSFAEAIVIKDGRVLAVGSNADVAKYKTHANQVIDLGGRTVIPGLCDSHLHFIREGMNFTMELRWDGVTSLAQALQMLRDQAHRTPDGQWIRVVGGWYEHQFEEKRMPTLEEINEAAGDKPVFVLHLYDCALVNKVGLKLLGYDKDTPNPPSGEIQRDATGTPTGLLIARPNAFLLYNTLNKLPKLGFEEQRISTLAYQRELNRFGLTSCLDPGGGFQRFPEDYQVIQALDKEQLLSVRISYSLFPQKPKQELEDFKRWADMVSPGQGSDFLKHLGAGEMLAFSAADFEDFKEPRPDLPHDMESDLEAIVRFLVSKRWPFRLHATYGESIERELAVFEKIEKEKPGSFAGLRWFIDHAETISERDIKRIHALGGGIAIQHRMAFQGEYFAKRYGKEAAEIAPPISAMLQHGVHVGAGTDGTRVATYNPWLSLFWLATGKTAGGLQLYPQSNIRSRTEALRLWTKDNAWFCFEEKSRGSLVAGMVGDLAVLSKDFFTVPDDDIKAIESVLTVVGGKIVYTDGSFRPAVKETGFPVQQHLSPVWSPVKFVGGYQLAGSTSWVLEDSKSAHVAASSTSSSASASGTGASKAKPHGAAAAASSTSGASAHPTPDPSEFFTGGHDC